MTWLQSALELHIPAYLNVSSDLTMIQLQKEADLDFKIAFLIETSDDRL